MRTILLLLLYGILAVLLIPVVLVCYLGGWRKPIVGIGKIFIPVGRRILGLKLEVIGVERVDKEEAYIFMGNHLSLLDGPLLFWLIPQSISVILKKEIFRIPIIGQGMKVAGFIPVDRRRMKGGKKSIEEAVRQVKEKGLSFLIFPEGTRSRDGRLQSFKRGGFFLALDSQASIVPISIQGTYELMPRKSFFAKKGKIKVRFHAPQPVGDYDLKTMPRLIEVVRNTIKSGLEE